MSTTPSPPPDRAGDGGSPGRTPDDSPGAAGSAEPAAVGAVPDADETTGDAAADADAEPTADEVPADEEPTDAERRVVVDPATVRRAPRFGRFIVLGVVLGALLSLALVLASPPSALARSDLFWLLFIGLGFLGGLAGAVVALLLDRRSWRRRAAGRPRP